MKPLLTGETPGVPSKEGFEEGSLFDLSAGHRFYRQLENNQSVILGELGVSAVELGSSPII
ncbi:MAG TPA: hypothetical protein VJQ50_01950 [Terriglobales bacterium]|nr:hypothetical protein [Terriglobales bacterium]